MNALRKETENADKLNKKKFIEDSGITGSVGYGIILFMLTMMDHIFMNFNYC